MATRGVLKPTLQITALSFLGIILSFISQLIIAYYFGATAERDAYFAAIVLPTYLTAIITGSIGFIFLPQVVELRNQDSLCARKFINNTLSCTVLLLLILIFFGIIFSESILSLTVPGFEAKMIVYTGKLFRILLFSSIFNVLTNLINSLYQITHKFVRPAFTTIINVPISIVLVVIFQSEIGIMSLAIGTLLGSIVSFLLVLPILFTEEFKFSFHIDISENQFISMIKVSLPLMLGGIIFRSAPVFERMIASGLEEGSISILGYSGQLLSVLTTIATNGIVISLFPSMSDAWTKDVSLFVQYFNKGIRSILILTIPIALIFVLFGDTFVKILYERGEFTTNVTLAVSRTFAYMTPAFVALSLGGITAKVFYISKRTIEFTIISSFELFAYLLLSYLLSQKYGYLGIAMATSIAYFFFMFVYYFHATFFLIKKYDYRLILLDTLKIIFCSALCYFTCSVLFSILKKYVHEYIAIGLSVFVSFIIYLLFLKKLKNEEVNTLVQKLKSFIYARLKNLNVFQK